MAGPEKQEEERYLEGLRVLITRPVDQAEETAAAVLAAGGVPLLFPCLVMAPPPEPQALDAALGDLARFEVVALTSVNAVRALGERMAALGGDLAEGLRGCLVAAVGERTAAALRCRGVRVDLSAAEPTAEGLAAALRAAGAPRTVLLPRALEGREVLEELLGQAGARVSAVAAYHMVAAPPARLSPACVALRAGEVDLVPFGSPRTAAVLLDALGEVGRAALQGVAVGAIGPTTAAALFRAGVAVDVVARPSTFEALLRALGEVRRKSPAGHKGG